MRQHAVSAFGEYCLALFALFSLRSEAADDRFDLTLPHHIH